MKKKFKLAGLAFLIVTTALTGCKDQYRPPILTATSVSGIMPVSASTGGMAEFCKGDEMADRGFFLSIDRGPAPGSGIFSGNMTDSYENTTYYIRIRKMNSTETSQEIQLNITAETGSGLLNFDADLDYGSSSDATGGDRKTIHIGTQILMTGNPGATGRPGRMILTGMSSSEKAYYTRPGSENTWWLNVESSPGVTGKISISSGYLSFLYVIGTDSKFRNVSLISNN